MDSRQRHIIQTVYDKTGLIQFKTDMQKAQAMASTMGRKVSANAKYMGTTVKESYQKVGNSVARVTMKTATFVEKGKQMKVVWRDTAHGAKAVGMSVGKAGTAMGNFSAMMGKAMKRALIVAPVWLALRSAMMFVIRTISEGMKYWAEWDRQLMKSKAVIHGVAGGIEVAYQRLQKEVKELAVTTGESMTKITSAFYRFGTVGLDFETSINGMKTATDLAIAMFGDADQIARVLAQAYRLLGHTIDKSIAPQDHMLSIGAQLYKLWRTNAFEINEMTGALQRFLPTANAFNFTMTETLGLLATLQTAGLKSTKAGRLLASGINRLVGNLDKLGSVLGIYINPQMDSTYDILMKVLGSVNKLQKGGANLSEVFKAMGVFGGVRQRQAGLALIALYDTLRENNEAIKTQDIAGLMRNLASRTDEVTDSVGRQTKRMEELRKQAGMTFLQMIFGGEKFVETLKNINTSWETMIFLMENVNKVKQFVSPISAIKTISDIPQRQTKRMEYQIENFQKLFAQMQDKEISKAERKGMLISLKFLVETKALKESKDRIKSMIKEITGGEKAQQKVRENTEKTERRLSREVEHRVDELQTELKLLNMELRGVNAIEIAQQDLNAEIRKMSVAYAIDKVGKDYENFSETQIKGTREYNILLEDTVDLVNRALRGDKGAIEEAKAIFMAGVLLGFVEKRHKIEVAGARDVYGKAEKLHKLRLNMAKVMGASELKLLDMQEKRARMLNDENKLYDIKLQKQLAIQNIIKQTADLQLSAMERYIKATEEERQVMEEVFDLMRLKPEVLRFEIQKYDKDVQTAFMNMKAFFDPEQVRAGMTGIMQDMGLFFKEIVLTQDIARRHGATREVTRIGRVRGEGGEWEDRPYKAREWITPEMLKAPTGGISIAPTFPGDIIIHIDRRIKDIAGESGKQFKLKLLNILDSPEGKKIIENIAWDMTENGR